MKAIVYDAYGAPEVLRLEEVDRPCVGEDDVLVQVRAASVNSWDWDNLRGRPLPYRVLSGLFRPKWRILGADIAGRVEAVGSKVTRFAVGDEVFGDLCECGWGAFAEYACARESALAHKSARMTFEQAAALPQAGVMALQGVRDFGQLRPGQRILINGAGGGVGSLAIQMAKAYGAEVTAVDSTKKLAFMRSLGADHVVDYTTEDFASSEVRYDVILDVTAHRSMFDYRRVLAPAGRYVLLGGAIGRILQTLLFWGWLRLIRSAQSMTILAHQPNRDLSALVELFESGKVVPAIDRTYSLSETPQALRRLGEGAVLGKAVVTL